MKCLSFSALLGVSSVAGELVIARKDNGVHEAPPMAKVSQAVPFGDVKGNEKREKLATEIQEQVRRDSRANYRISGLFANFEKEDDAALRTAKADKNMLALIQKNSRVEPAAKVTKVSKQASLDDVQAQINAQRRLVVDIHTPFADKAKQDAHEFEKIKKDPRLQAMLIQEKKNAWDDSSSDIYNGDHSNYVDTVKSFDWRKLSDEITQSAEENGLGDRVAAVKAEDDSAKTSADSTSTDFDNSAADNMDAMNKYIAKFSVDKPSDVPKRMNPYDFNQDVRHSSNYGGSVISIPLSSQLQTSFLQKSSSHAKIAPGVEEEVAKEKKWDVYLADGFRTQEERDETEVRRMKGRKEYGE